MTGKTTDMLRFDHGCSLCALLFLPHQCGRADKEQSPAASQTGPLRQQVIYTALQLLSSDLQQILQASLETVHSGDRISTAAVHAFTQPVCVICRQEQLSGLTSAELSAGIEAVCRLTGTRTEALGLMVQHDMLYLAGSDSRGLAYALLEVSRMLGVHPLSWWSDIPVQRRDCLELPADLRLSSHPDVRYRGIFINDEDWGFMPWSCFTQEPAELGHIGPETYRKVFELMLRLRLNILWPAMHECTYPFFMTEGNKEAAAAYGIVLGASHAEPMACSAAREWDLRGQGQYNFRSNRQGVLSFWQQRLDELTDSDEIMFTLGMRGKHDGKLQGVSGTDESRALLEDVLVCQRQMLQDKYGRADAPAQVFIPYKEVLSIYRSGLEVPDDVTLMWTDDNYGYIRHFPTPEERARKGGNGLYYHASYWGRPHDYLWLGSQSPYLMAEELTRAYMQGIRQVWILNVGDIKPLEYQLSLFADLAWDMHCLDADTDAGAVRTGSNNATNIRKEQQEPSCEQQIAAAVIGTYAHIQRFYAAFLPQELAARTAALMDEFYRLSFRRKPEFMGGTREEEADPAWRRIRDLPFSAELTAQLIAQHEKQLQRAELLWQQVPEALQDCMYELVVYQVKCAALLSLKHLYAMQDRHGANMQLSVEAFARSDRAYDAIMALTRRFNTGFANNGKFNKMMDAQPRLLPVFDPITDRRQTDKPLPAEPVCLGTASAQAFAGTLSLPGLGYNKDAALLPAHGTATACLQGKGKYSSDTAVCLQVHFLPVFAAAGDSLQACISLLDSSGDTVCSQVFELQTKGRSEQWKENVLGNRTTCSLPVPSDKAALCKKAGSLQVRIEALTDSLFVDGAELIALS